MAHLRAREDRPVREHAQGQGTRNLPEPAALRGSADLAGGRRQVRDQPRARAPDRSAAEKAAQAVPQVTGLRYRAGRALAGPQTRAPPERPPLLRRNRDAIMAIAMMKGEQAAQAARPYARANV